MKTKSDLISALNNLKIELSNALNGLPLVDNLSEPDCENAICEKHGEFTQWSRIIPLLNKKFSTRCPNCLREEIKKFELELEKFDEEQRQKRIQLLKDQSNIPLRFAQARFENYQENAKNKFAKTVCQRYAEKWEERFAQGGGLVFCGKPGTGKNHLACAIANSVIENHQSDVLLTTAMRVIRKVKSTWDKNAEMTEDEVIQVYCQKDLLIIDEIGVQFGSDAEKIILFEIINNRYEDMKPTILISNLSQEELSQYVGERIIDRMKEGQGAVVNFNWESFRK
ncbi:chromosomal replication initiator protein DnaA [[Pasteurella] mairii]|uniref:Chromosomal replication initiator protein DnaA n=1 Tax=[Pasteurella] mairii TaxID=757 RepID=A0A379B5J1_9PAST|nr:chromosomal replication initiator protein DnaA [[Pasteurella] mairii]